MSIHVVSSKNLVFTLPNIPSRGNLYRDFPLRYWQMVTYRIEIYKYKVNRNLIVRQVSLHYGRNYLQYLMIITSCYTLPSDILSNRHTPSHIRLSKRCDMTIRQSDISIYLPDRTPSCVTPQTARITVDGRGSNPRPHPTTREAVASI